MCRRKCDNIFFEYIVESEKLLVKREQMALKDKGTYVYFFIIIRYSSVFILTDVYNSVFNMETTFSSKWRLKPSRASTQMYYTVNFKYLHTHTTQLLSEVEYCVYCQTGYLNSLISHRICNIDTYLILNETHNVIWHAIL